MTRIFYLIFFSERVETNDISLSSKSKTSPIIFLLKCYKVYPSTIMALRIPFRFPDNNFFQTKLKMIMYH